MTKAELKHRYKGDPEKCYHLHVMRTSYGRICTVCGTLLTPARSISEFLSILDKSHEPEWVEPTYKGEPKGDEEPS